MMQYSRLFITQLTITRYPIHGGNLIGKVRDLEIILLRIWLDGFLKAIAGLTRLALSS